MFVGGDCEQGSGGVGCLWGAVSVQGRYFPGVPLATLPCSAPDSSVTLQRGRCQCFPGGGGAVVQVAAGPLAQAHGRAGGHPDARCSGDPSFQPTPPGLWRAIPLLLCFSAHTLDGFVPSS